MREYGARGLAIECNGNGNVPYDLSEVIRSSLASYREKSNNSTRGQPSVEWLAKGQHGATFYTSDRRRTLHGPIDRNGNTAPIETALETMEPIERNLSGQDSHCLCCGEQLSGLAAIAKERSKAARSTATKPIFSSDTKVKMLNLYMCPLLLL